MSQPIPSLRLTQDGRCARCGYLFLSQWQLREGCPNCAWRAKGLPFWSYIGFPLQAEPTTGEEMAACG